MVTVVLRSGRRNSLRSKSRRARKISRTRSASNRDGGARKAPSTFLSSHANRKVAAMNIVSNEEITRVIDLHEVRSAKTEPARHNFNDALADVITIGLQGGVPWQ